jgi:hypothetical protein
MRHRREATPKRAVEVPPVVFKAGAHTLSICFVAEGRWTVSVDGGAASQTFGTQVEAWEAGVRAVDEQDRLRGP